MRADNIEIDELSDADHAALSAVRKRQGAMLERVTAWSAINTGSWNADGLNAFAPLLAKAFGETDADVTLLDTTPIETITDKAETRGFQSGPVVRAQARPDAPLQVVMTGHYDTVFPKGTFEAIKDLGGGKLNGPGLADMKGGITVMIEAIKAFEAGPMKGKLGYTVVLSPDEETGNFASAPHIKAAAEGAHIGLTFEPAMEDGSLAGARKGSAVYDIIFHGKSVHAGREPENGRSAIWAAAEFALAIETLNGQRDGVTFNVGSINGGGAVNIVPELGIVRMGVRAPDGPSADWADASVRAAFDKACQRPDIHGHVHGGFYRPPNPATRRKTN
ncbi:hydrolase [Litorimonas sp. RW-G-Af-16]|uniref:hydrolase n=1 Tax=Litorimonas sp. RW-G-Af-16 TaxID=3241168 RepID=UPI003AAB3EFD